MPESKAIMPTPTILSVGLHFMAPNSLICFRAQAKYMIPMLFKIIGICWECQYHMVLTSANSTSFGQICYHERIQKESALPTSTRICLLVYFLQATHLRGA
jgi:hypothetical protein